MRLHTGVYGHRKTICTESWQREKKQNLLTHRGIEPASAACRSDALPTELHPHPGCSSITVVFTKHAIVQFSKTTVKIFGAVQACSSIIVVFTKHVVVQFSKTTVKLFGAVPVENRELEHTWSCLLHLSRLAGLGGSWREVNSKHAHTHFYSLISTEQR